MYLSDFPSIEERLAAEMISSLYEVRKVEVLNVVARNYVGIDLANEVGPLFEQFLFVVVRENFGSNDRSARFQCEDVLYERLRFAVNRDDVRDLDDWDEQAGKTSVKKKARYNPASKFLRSRGGAW